jgi:hypothetical protein
MDGAAKAAPFQSQFELSMPIYETAMASEN